MKDPFEEFEFKPLTEGLGFRKADRQETGISKSPAKPVSLGIEFVEDSPLNPPLPRENKSPTFPTQPDSTKAVDEILRTLRSKQTPLPDIQPAAPKKQTIILEPTVSSISAMFLDAMLVLAGSLLCMIILLSVTKADIASTLLSGEPDRAVIAGTIGLFALVTFVYLVANRIFLGATPGEWAYDQRLGIPEDMGTYHYAMSVVIRSLVVILTGLIPLPLLSVIFRIDIAGILSGTQIFERT